LAEVRVNVGDEASLLESFRPRLLYFALRRLRDRTIAEEIVQDTLTAVLEALRADRLEDPAKLPGYVFGVARNLVSKAFRTRLLEANHDSDPELIDLGPWLEDREAALLLEEQRQQVREALGQLSPNDRDILQRTFVEEQSLEEIAGAVGIPYAAARKRKSRALERLRKIFQQRSQEK
jgi:RNA polymerase sigma-70 factor (ECF subfamily)